MSYEHGFDSRIRPNIAARAEPAHAVLSRSQLAETASGKEAGGTAMAPEVASDEDFSFYDLIDVINPLQHIPLVSSLYREMTGDQIKAPARVLGGFLFGGPVGFVSSVANAIAVESSGRDLGEAAIASLFGAEPDYSDLAEAGETGSSAPALAGDPLLAQVAGAEPAAGGFAHAGDPESARSESMAAGTSATELLMGRAALDALAADLRGRPRPAAGAAADAPAEPPASSGAAIAAAAKTGAAKTETAEPPSAAGTARADERPAVIAPANGVPANLAGLGSRDRRGLGPILPSQAPRPDGPEALEDSLRPAHQRRGSTADRVAMGLFPPLAGQSPIDPTLLPPPPLPDAMAKPGNGSAWTGGGDAVGSAADAEGGLDGDLSAQMLKALKKYEALMQARRGGEAASDPARS